MSCDAHGGSRGSVGGVRGGGSAEWHQTHPENAKADIVLDGVDSCGDGVEGPGAGSAEDWGRRGGGAERGCCWEGRGAGARWGGGEGGSARRRRTALDAGAGGLAAERVGGDEGGEEDDGGVDDALEELRGQDEARGAGGHGGTGGGWVRIAGRKKDGEWRERGAGAAGRAPEGELSALAVLGGALGWREGGARRAGGTSVSLVGTRWRRRFCKRGAFRTARAAPRRGMDGRPRPRLGAVHEDDVGRGQEDLPAEEQAPAVRMCGKSAGEGTAGSARPFRR